MWTLEGELCRLTGIPLLNASLVNLEMIPNEASEFVLTTINDWERSGSETYSYRFQVRTHHAVNDFVIKACVAWSFDSALETILAEWIRRRLLIQRCGVPTPKLFAWGSGVILEEYIPFSFRTTLVTQGRLGRSELLFELVRYAALLTKLGFCPIDAFGDLRSRGTDLVPVDFGQDLGPPENFGQQRNVLFHALLSSLASWKLELLPAERAQMKHVYESLCGNGV